MKKNNNLITGIIAGIIILLIGVFTYLGLSGDKPGDDKFEVVESNYLERNKERYINYRKNHRDYSDDKIITNVNIGLDKEAYTDIQETNIEDGVLMLTNKYYALNKDYTPKLVKIDSYNIMVQEEVARQFAAMAKDARESTNGEVELIPLEGYQSYDIQRAIYDIQVNDNGEKVALNHAPKPGHSDFGTGLALNISGVSDGFQYSKEYSWLSNHSYEYGFILRYPKDKTDITGFEFEPGHFRYVGIEAAKVMHDKHLTLDEYYVTYVLK